MVYRSRRSFLVASGAVLASTGVTSAENLTLPDRMVYAGTLSGIAAFDLETGSPMWTYDEMTDGIGQPSPIVVDGNVYIGGHDDAVHAIGAESGEQQWIFDPFPSSVETSPTVIDGVVYAGSSQPVYEPDGPNFFAIDVATGEEIWSRELGTVWSSPQVVEGVVYISEVSASERLLALDAESGETLWQVDDERVWTESSPLVVQDRLFIGTANGELLAVRRETGEVLWSYEQEETIRTSPVVENETVFFGDRARYLHAVDAVSGSERWANIPRPDLPDRTFQPTVADGTIYLGARGHLFAIDAGTGETEWYYPDSEIKAIVWESPTVVDDYVLCAMDGSLFAISASDGKLLWRQDDLDISDRTAPTVTDDPLSGHSIDSRVLQGTLGHHHDTSFAEQQLDTDSDSLGAGLGVAGAVAGIGAGAYLSWRRHS